MKNPLAWLAGAVVLYLATRPRHVGVAHPAAPGTGSIDGHTTPPHPTPALPSCPSGLYAWEGDCVAWGDLPSARQQEILQALGVDIARPYAHIAQ